MSVRLNDPTLKVLSKGKRLTVYGLPNPGQKVTFEGTRQEVIKWLRDKGAELTEKALKREIEEVEITQLPERIVTKMMLKDMAAERLKDVFAEELTNRVASHVAEKANEILKEKKLVGGSIDIGVDRELSLVHVYVEEPKTEKEVKLKYEPFVIGPVEMKVRYIRRSPTR